MDVRSLKNRLKIFKYTPLHPQWLTYRHFKKEMEQMSTMLGGKHVLDIGCGEQEIRSYLSADTIYYGLDYYETATHWYNTRPDVYGDAQALPVANGSVDAVLLMDVLEHLPRPEACLEEIGRVLRPGGCCVVQVPFLYPIHDAPLDFHRWTRHGLDETGHQYDFTIREFHQTGKPLETAALLSNFALCKTLLNLIDQKNPLVLLGVCLPILIPVINILAYLADFFTPTDDFMPFRYRFILEKSPKMVETRK